MFNYGSFFTSSSSQAISRRNYMASSSWNVGSANSSEKLDYEMMDDVLSVIFSFLIDIHQPWHKAALREVSVQFNDVFQQIIKKRFNDAPQVYQLYLTQTMAKHLAENYADIFTKCSIVKDAYFGRTMNRDELDYNKKFKCLLDGLSTPKLRLGQFLEKYHQYKLQNGYDALEEHPWKSKIRECTTALRIFCLISFVICMFSAALFIPSLKDNNPDFRFLAAMLYCFVVIVPLSTYLFFEKFPTLFEAQYTFENLQSRAYWSLINKNGFLDYMADSFFHHQETIGVDSFSLYSDHKLHRQFMCEWINEYLPQRLLIGQLDKIAHAFSVFSNEITDDNWKKAVLVNFSNEENHLLMHTIYRVLQKQALVAGCEVRKIDFLNMEQNISGCESQILTHDETNTPYFAGYLFNKDNPEAHTASLSHITDSVYQSLKFFMANTPKDSVSININTPNQERALPPGGRF